MSINDFPSQRSTDDQVVYYFVSTTKAGLHTAFPPSSLPFPVIINSDFGKDGYIEEFIHDGCIIAGGFVILNYLHKLLILHYITCLYLVTKVIVHHSSENSV